MKITSIRTESDKGWYCCGVKNWPSAPCSRCRRPDPDWKDYGC